MTTRPPEVGYADKLVWGITLEDVMVGCADVIRGWPSNETAYIGLLLLTESHHGTGLVRRAYEAIEAQARQWPQVRTLRLAVVATNAQNVALAISIAI
jgi:RimJ/RimL family protein N-acetyltransferase